MVYPLQKFSNINTEEGSIESMFTGCLRTFVLFDQETGTAEEFGRSSLRRQTIESRECAR